MKTLILMSDNHGDEEVTRDILAKETYDISVHLGDSLEPESGIKRQFDIYVSGNNEYFSTFEEQRVIEGLNILFIHGHKAGIVDGYEERGYEFAKERGADILIFGHTHTPFNKDVNGIRFINPGSTTLPRNGSKKSYALLKLDKKKIVDVIFKNI